MWTLKNKKRQSKTCDTRRQLQIEGLESRTLMAANVTASLNNGILNIDGTPKADTIIVRQIGNVISVDGVKIKGSGVINKIQISALGGDDTVRLDADGRSDQAVKVPCLVWGGDGNDHIVGGKGRDELQGQRHNDTIFGMDGDDVLFGQDGNDTMHGGAGSDRLYGGAGNDQLAGGAGVDYLYGGDGADGLIGGQLSAQDYLYGEAGADRFLRQNDDFGMDRKPEDASFIFRDGSSAWTEDELQVVDQAFAGLQAATGNTRLLKDTLSNSELIFQKENSRFADAGLNSEWPVYERYWDIWQFTWKKRYLWTDRLIQIRDFNESTAAGRADAIDIVIHELGHNWDSSQERSNAGVSGSTWDTFARISDWRSSNPGATHYLSGDGKWYYSKASRQGFFGPVLPTGRGNSLYYGKWNPHEDFATSFAEWFRILRNWGPFGISGGIAGPQRNAFAQAKLESVSNLVRRLT